MTPRLLFAIATATVLALGSCKKDQVSGVPATTVDIYINMNLPEYNAVTVPGGWVYLTGGSQGLILYRATNDDFVALDRHCPYQPQNLCRVKVDNSSVIARDSACCGSAFLIIDGSVTNGPATFALKRYNTTFNGTTLHIYN